MLTTRRQFAAVLGFGIPWAIAQLGSGPAQGALAVAQVLGGSSASPSPSPQLAPQAQLYPYHVGLNITGGEIYDDTPHGNRYMHGYIYPDDQTVLSQFHNVGIRVVQLPFKIERVWPDFSQGLNMEEVARIKRVLAVCNQIGLKVMVSPHNFGRYKNFKVGSREYPWKVFGIFWGLFSQELRNEAGLWGYSLDTEPFELGIQFWQPAAQEAVNSIRQFDRIHRITIPGADHWGNSELWRNHSNALRINDDTGNFAFEATCYGDWNFSGTYRMSYAEQAQHPNPKARAHPYIMVDRVRPFLEWCAEHNYQAIVSEWGIPTTDPNWLEVANNFLAYLETMRVSSSAWAWGPWWGGLEQYPLFIEPGGEFARLLGSYATRATQFQS